MSRFANIESAQDQLLHASLPKEDVDRLLSSARDALVFQRQAGPDADIAPGASKLGGAPDMAPGTARPTRPAYAEAQAMMTQSMVAHGPDGYAPNAELLAFHAAHWAAPAPLSFLGQIDLSAAAQAGPFDIGLPSVGRLMVFLDNASYADGALGWDDGWITVFHDTTPREALERHPLPDTLVEIQNSVDRLKSYQTGPLDLSRAEALTPFPIVTVPLETRRYPIPVVQALWDMDLDDMPDLRGSGGPSAQTFIGDQLGGNPRAIQNDVAYDLYESAFAQLRPVTQAERAGDWDPYRWTHLLSIAGESCTPAFPSDWGDGDLYIGHRPDPARPQALGQVWAISQRT